MITYDEILQRMKTAYKEKSGFDISEESDIGIRMRVLSGEIYKTAVNIEWLKNQMFPQTATGEQLDKHAQLRGITRKTATKSEGFVMFGINEAVDVNIRIPKGTVVATADASPVLFETLYDATIISGRLTAGADVICLESGAKGNVKQGKVCVMTMPPAGVDYVVNDEEFSGGTDDETDEQLRQRIIYSFNNISNGINSAFYTQQAMKTDGVYSVGVIGCNRGLGTVDVFLSGQGCSVTEDIVKRVQQDMNAQKDINTDVLVKAAIAKPVSVFLNMCVKEGYDFSEVKKTVVRALQKYVGSLGIGKGVYLVDLGDIIYHTEGVKRYDFILENCGDTEVPQSKYAFLDRVVIGEMQ